MFFSNNVSVMFTTFLHIHHCFTFTVIKIHGNIHCLGDCLSWSCFLFFLRSLLTLVGSMTFSASSAVTRPKSWSTADAIAAVDLYNTMCLSHAVASAGMSRL